MAASDRSKHRLDLMPWSKPSRLNWFVQRRRGERTEDQAASPQPTRSSLAGVVCRCDPRRGLGRGSVCLPRVVVTDIEEAVCRIFGLQRRRGVELNRQTISTSISAAADPIKPSDFAPVVNRRGIPLHSIRRVESAGGRRLTCSRRAVHRGRERPGALLAAEPHDEAWSRDRA